MARIMEAALTAPITATLMATAIMGGRATAMEAVTGAAITRLSTDIPRPDIPRPDTVTGDMREVTVGTIRTITPTETRMGAADMAVTTVAVKAVTTDSIGRSTPPLWRYLLVLITGAHGGGGASQAPPWCRVVRTVNVACSSPLRKRAIAKERWATGGFLKDQLFSARCACSLSTTLPR